MPELRNTRHEIFAQELAKGRTATDAYVTAGYELDDAHASRLAGNETVRARVRELQGKAAKRAGVTIERVLKAYAEIAFADMGQYAKWDENGVRLVDSATLTRAQQRVVSEVSETKGEFGNSVKFKLHDKVRALDALARYLGMAKNNVEVTGKDGGPIQGTWIDIVKAAHQEEARDADAGDE